METSSDAISLLLQLIVSRLGQFETSSAERLLFMTLIFVSAELADRSTLEIWFVEIMRRSSAGQSDTSIDVRLQLNA